MSVELLQRLGVFLRDASVYIAIGLVTWVGLVKCIYPVLRNAALLNRAVVQLEKSSAKGKPGIWKDAHFLGRSLREDWQRFLINAGQMDLRGMPYDTQEYINEDSVIYKPGHAQLAELIPSLLTSLGILGTFMGLMQGLTDLDFSNAEGTIHSIPNLLQGMRFAFATSVAGIACSLSFNMLNRVAVGRAFKAIDNLDEAFYDLAMPRPLAPEVQLVCQQQREEVSFKRAAEAVGNQVAGTLELAISRAMHPLTLSMDQFIKGATQEQVAGIKAVAGQFVEQMNASLDGQLTALGDAMRLVNQGQVQAQQSLQRTLQTAEMLNQDARRIQEACGEIARQMSALSGEMEREARLRDHRALEAQGLEARQSALGEQLEALTLSLGRMNAAVQAQSRRMEEQEAPPKPAVLASLGHKGRRPKAAKADRATGLEG